MASDLKIVIDLSAHGPLADGSAHQRVVTWLDHVKRVVAQKGQDYLRSFVMDKTGRATGHYQSEVQIRTYNSFNDLLLTDPVVYGPWLEGTSERNRSTRFKGYHLWRKTRQELERQMPAIVEQEMPKLIAELEG